ncbi:MAG: Mur ligase domain-containing protein [Patescibacteria group bacterium]
MRIHFIGIGGIGVSALAWYYLAQGWKVSGSDLAASEIIQDLKSAKVSIKIGHQSANLPDKTDLVVYSAACAKNNPELKKARVLKIPVLSYAEAIGELTKKYFTITVSGAHGKSTTTAMLALMMIKAGLDPTVIIGTKLKEFGASNFRAGKSRYLVLEADEWNRSFLRYYPNILVLTNIDKEHLDTYKNLQGVIKAFGDYFQNIVPGGKIVANGKDKNIRQALNLKKIPAKVIFYNKGQWRLGIPGDYNKLNAEAAWQAGRLLGVPKQIAVEVLRKYRGSWRRAEPLELKRTGKEWQSHALSLPKGFKFFSDYAHHPAEIKASISGFKKMFPKKPLAIIFQPHQMKRLNDLFRDFISGFKEVDVLALLPVYQVAGREFNKTNKAKDSKDLFAAIKKAGWPKQVFYLQEFKESFNILKSHPGAVVVFMGAGDIDNEVRKYFISKLLPM